MGLFKHGYHAIVSALDRFLQSTTDRPSCLWPMTVKPLQKNDCLKWVEG